MIRFLVSFLYLWIGLYFDNPQKRRTEYEVYVDNFKLGIQLIAYLLDTKSQLWGGYRVTLDMPVIRSENKM